MSEHLHGKMSFFVHGTPVPQGSLSSFVSKTTGAVISPQKKKLIAWRTEIAKVAYSTMLRSGIRIIQKDTPVFVSMNFVLQRPKSHYKMKSIPDWPTARPDIDKLARAVLDAISGTVKGFGGVMVDDSMVVKLGASKRYTFSIDEYSGVYVSIHWEN